MSTFSMTFIGRSHSLCGLTLTLLIALLAGCGGAIANEPAVHRAGPDLRGYYGTRTPAQLAYGGPTGVAPGYTRERPDLDSYLKPGERAQTRAMSERAPIARALPKAAAAPTTQAAAPQPEAREPQLLAAATPAPTPPVATPSSADDAQRYAARESRSSQQQQYRGGDVVVISATTIIVILLVVLLILLLT